MAVHRGTTRLIPTGRGTGVLIAGVSMVVLGVGFASGPLTYVGVITACAVALSALWVALTGIVLPVRYGRVTRTVGPGHPMVGTSGHVTTTVTPTRWNATTHAMVRGLGISEQAAAEVTGTAHQRAAVSRADRALALTYPITPALRGTWNLGPAVVSTHDPLGLMHAWCALGGTDSVGVWPEVHDLSDVARAVMGDAEQRRSGTTSAAADDAHLREYREGDDLRRVHWASTARRGTMFVRADEHEGKRPASVIVDLPFDPRGTEWAISAAASIACAVLDSGHDARIYAPALPEGPRRPGDARSALLDSLLALEAPTRRRADDLLTAIDSAALHARRGAVTFAVIDPPSDIALTALSSLGADGRAWALVRQSNNPDAAHRAAAALAAAGWHTTVVDAHAGVPNAWASLVTEAVAS